MPSLSAFGLAWPGPLDPFYAASYHGRMDGMHTRTAMLLGPEAIARLASARVAVFGLGGVGSYVAEGLARTGIGALVLLDDDCISLSNLNRQLPALRSTLGRVKVEAMAERLLDINPRLEIRTHREFFDASCASRLLTDDLDYVVDAIDTVSSKIALVMGCRERGLAIISSMGMGNKLDPTLIRIADINDTIRCPLARVMRKELRARGVDHLTVAYSQEQPIKPVFFAGGSGAGGNATDAGVDPDDVAPRPGKKSVPASAIFVPAAAGLIIASRVVRDLCSTPPDAAVPPPVGSGDRRR